MHQNVVDSTVEHGGTGLGLQRPEVEAALGHWVTLGLPQPHSAPNLVPHELLRACYRCRVCVSAALLNQNPFHNIIPR